MLVCLSPHSYTRKEKGAVLSSNGLVECSIIKLCCHFLLDICLVIFSLFLHFDQVSRCATRTSILTNSAQ